MNTQNNTAIENLKNEIMSKSFMNILDLNQNANPSKNYEILHVTLQDAKEIHMRSKTIKFNKWKQKKSKWITFGIIKSINYRDNMYKNLKMAHPESAQYETLRNNLDIYNNKL